MMASDKVSILNQLIALEDEESSISEGTFKAQFYRIEQGITGYAITAPKNDLSWQQEGYDDVNGRLERDFEQFWASVDCVAEAKGVEHFSMQYWQLFLDLYNRLVDSIGKMPVGDDKAYGEKLLQYMKEVQEFDQVMLAEMIR